jgi:hypothetical protein
MSVEYANSEMYLRHFYLNFLENCSSYGEYVLAITVCSIFSTDFIRSIFLSDKYLRS